MPRSSSILMSIYEDEGHRIPFVRYRVKFYAYGNDDMGAPPHISENLAEHGDMLGDGDDFFE